MPSEPHPGGKMESAPEPGAVLPHEATAVDPIHANSLYEMVAFLTYAESITAFPSIRSKTLPTIEIRSAPSIKTTADRSNVQSPPIGYLMVVVRMWLD